MSSPSNPSAGTARDDAAFLTERDIAIILAAANAARAVKPGLVAQLAESHEALRSALAEREADCERLREHEQRDLERLALLCAIDDDGPDLRMAIDPDGFSSGFAEFTDFLDDVLRIERERVRSAAVAPADEKEEWTCRACGRMTTGGTWISTPRCGWCGADRAAVAPAAREPNQNAKEAK